MKIRQAVLTDLPALINIFENGRKTLRAAGNNIQWINGYPNEDVITKDIESNHNLVCIIDENDVTDLPLNTVIATFCMYPGANKIFDNVPSEQWLNDQAYWTIQRLCSSGQVKGAGVFCLKWATEHYDNIKIYTHESNQYMTKIINKCGFKSCGQGLILDNTPRSLYQYERHNTSQEEVIVRSEVS